MTPLSFVVTLIAFTYVLAEEKLYTDKFDDINVQEILENNKLREQYYKCYIGSGPCLTEAAKYLKKMFGEAFVENCRKCTEKQKQGMNLLVDWFTKNKPEQWQIIVAKTIEYLKQENSE